MVAAAVSDMSPAQYVPISVAVRESGGISRQSILRWATKKEIKAERQANGQWHVWLDDVLQRALGGAKPVEPEDYEDAMSPGTVFAQMVEALKASNRHVETLIAPVKVVLDTLRDENMSLRARANDLETKLQSFGDKWEQALSLEHERRLQEARQARELERNERVLNLLLEYAPVVTAGVAGHFGVDIVQESVLVKMVSDLSEEQIGAILRSGALSPQNLAVLERIRATRKAAAAKKAENDGKAKQQTAA